MQGWRISMEDAHTAVLDLKREDGKSAPDDKVSFFAVYDGHGGSKAAIFAGQNLHNIVARQAAFEKGDYEQALKDGFLSTDRAILQGIYLCDLVPTNVYAKIISRCEFWK